MKFKTRTEALIWCAQNDGKELLCDFSGVFPWHVRVWDGVTEFCDPLKMWSHGDWRGLTNFRTPDEDEDEPKQVERPKEWVTMGEYYQCNTLPETIDIAVNRAVDYVLAEMERRVVEK